MKQILLIIGILLMIANVNVSNANANVGYNETYINVLNNNNVIVNSSIPLTNYTFELKTDKNWVGMPFNSTINNADDLIKDIPNCDRVGWWDSESQEMKVYSRLSFPPWYGGTNFDVKAARGYEITVSSNTTWNLSCLQPTNTIIDYLFIPKMINKTINLTTSYDGYTCKFMDSTYETYATDNEIAIGKRNDIMTDRDKGFAEFDISSIPINAHITNVTFKYDGKIHNMDCNISNMTVQPTASTAQQIYDNIGTGADYYNDTGFPVVGSNQSVNLGLCAINDLQRKINNSITWFSIGLYTNSPISPVSLINASENVDATPPPTLQIDYQVPAENGATIGTKLISTQVGARKTTMAAAFMLLSGMFMMMATKRRHEDDQYVT